MDVIVGVFIALLVGAFIIYGWFVAFGFVLSSLFEARNTRKWRRKLYGDD